MRRRAPKSRRARWRAVMAAERGMGHEPRDVSAEKKGWDIESRTPDGHLRFIEVKGRHAEARDVILTKNEILASLNAPDAYSLAIVTDRSRLRARADLCQTLLPARTGFRRDGCGVQPGRVAVARHQRRRKVRIDAGSDRAGGDAMTHSQEADRGLDPAGGDQCGVGAGEVDPARASLDVASVVGAAAVWRRAARCCSRSLSMTRPPGRSGLSARRRRRPSASGCIRSSPISSNGRTRTTRPC